MADIMTPDHPRWDEFCDLLQGPEYCNFTQEDATNIQSVRWSCDNTRERPFTRAILEKMGGFDIKASMEYLYEHGGHCDCEILFNVGVDDFDDDFEGEDELETYEPNAEEK